MTIHSPLLKYHDNSITESDLYALQNNGWLSDSIIGFALNFFEHNLFKSFKHYFEFVSPSVVQLIRMTYEENDLDSVFNSLRIDKKKIALFPINNNDNFNIVGGSHWSLIVYIVDQELLLTFDSLNPLNNKISIVFFSRFKRIFPNAQVILNSNCPQQENSYDCGMYVILICKALCEHTVNNQGRIDCFEHLNAMLESKVTAESVQEGRKQLYEIILANSKS